MTTNIGALAVNLGLNSASFNQGLRTANDNLRSSSARWNRSVARSQRNFAGFNNTIQSTARQMFSLSGAAATLGAALSVRKLITVADTYKQLDARVKLVTNSTEEFTRAQNRLFSIAQTSRTSLEATTELYVRFARATKDSQTSQEDLLKVTEAISKAVTVSGASAASAGAALFQLSQGLAADALRGQELNSVLEQTPRLAEAIADGLGVAVGELRGLAEEGKLTAEVVLNAIKSQADTIDREFARIPRTVGQALQQLDNAFLRLVGQSAAVEAGTSSLALVISRLADNLGDIVQVVAAIGFAKLAAAAVRLTAGISALAVATRALGAALAFVGGPAGLAALALFAALSIGIDRSADSQARFNERMSRTVAITEELSIATGDRVEALNAEREAIVQNTIAEINATKARIESLKAINTANALTVARTGIAPEGINAGEIAALDQRLIEQAKQLNALLDQIYGEQAQERQTRAAETDEKRVGTLSKVNSSLERENELLKTRINNFEKGEDAVSAAVKAREIELDLAQQGVQLSQQEQEELQKKLELITQNTAALDRLQEEQEKTNDLLKEQEQLGRRAGESITNAFEDAILAGESFSDVLRDLANDIARLILRQQITGPLAGQLGGIFGGGGGLFDDLFGGLGSIFGFAEGGEPPVGRPSIVGEEGPELFVPQTRGTIIPNDMLGDGGNNMTVVQNINVSPGVPALIRSEIEAAAPVIAQAAKDSMYADVNRGGNAAKIMGRR